MARIVGRGAVLLLLTLALTCCGGDPGPKAVPTQHSDVAAPSGSAGRSATGAAPSHLEIPAIGLSTSLIELGLNKDETVEVPEDPARAGWFELGTVPGQRGSAVILGHVDSPDGPAVFADLSTLRTGDHIEVGLSDDTVVTFEVRRVATFANAEFPAQRVYAGTRGRRALNLVTCGGEYDRDRGGYQANVVVFTERVAG